MTNKIYFYTQKIIALYGYEKALRFFFYAHLHRKEFAPWFDFIETKLPPCFTENVKVRLIMRGASRFIRRWMTLAERLELLTFHYKALAARLSPARLAVILNETEELQAAALAGKSGKKYVMKISGGISKDGVLRIILRDPENGMRLASITGIIGPDKNGAPAFWVGALQGGTPLAAGKEVVVKGKQAVAEATKDLNGLRPKQAVLHAVAAIALWFGAQKIMAPSLKNQIAIKNWRKGQNIHTEYDTFWEEFTGGATGAHGDYCLSLPLPRRKLEAVQQKRRKDWLLRYERIDAMAAEIKKSLETL